MILEAENRYRNILFPDLEIDVPGNATFDQASERPPSRAGLIFPTRFPTFSNRGHPMRPPGPKVAFVTPSPVFFPPGAEGHGRVFTPVLAPSVGNMVGN